MVRLGRILRDYDEAGSVNSLISLWGFVDDVTFLTKSGAVGLVYRVRGVDDECLDHPERAAIARRFEQALRQLDESFRVYQYVIKRQSRPMTMAAHRQPIVNSDPALDLGPRAPFAPALLSCLSVPLVSGESLAGVLTLYSSQPKAFTEDQGRLVQMIAPHVATAVSRARRLEVLAPAAVAPLRLVANR